MHCAVLFTVGRPACSDVLLFGSNLAPLGNCNLEINQICRSLCRVQIPPLVYYTVDRYTYFIHQCATPTRIHRSCAFDVCV
ncbi:hypothetical protein F5Y17DRAFT_421160 [Xylariaceae sp. FL0594]|nr:hypothetical protein F5Y17DRAFT_421160 [Xylariaceae sp. FL0594]